MEDSTKVKKTKSKDFPSGTATNADNHTHLWEYGGGQTPNKLSISLWNVNGVRAVLNRKDINKYIDSTKPDIFCLN